MKILAISDIHSDLEKVKKLKKIEKEYDLIVIAGDITNFGNREIAERIIKEFGRKNIFAIPGNCDTLDVLEYLEERNINIHAKTKIFKEYVFCGLGYSLVTPFNTPLELTENEIEEILKKFEKCDILISHNPPFNTKLDLTKSNLHVGSKEIRKFIEEKKPKLVICGHIHEATGIDYINNTIITNVSALKNGNYAIIEIEKEIKVELKKL